MDYDGYYSDEYVACRRCHKFVRYSRTHDSSWWIIDYNKALNKSKQYLKIHKERINGHI
jgi:hypothetical protein